MRGATIEGRKVAGHLGLCVGKQCEVYEQVTEGYKLVTKVASLQVE